MGNRIEIIFFCLWLYYIPSRCILQDFFIKNYKLIINFQIVMFYLDYLIILENLFDILPQITLLTFCQFHCFFVNLWYNVRKGLVNGKKKENSYEPA